MKPTDREFCESFEIYQLRVMRNLGILSFWDEQDFGGLAFVISRREEKKEFDFDFDFWSKGVSILFSIFR